MQQYVSFSCTVVSIVSPGRLSKHHKEDLSDEFLYSSYFLPIRKFLLIRSSVFLCYSVSSSISIRVFKSKCLKLNTSPDNYLDNQRVGIFTARINSTEHLAIQRKPNTGTNFYYKLKLELLLGFRSHQCNRSNNICFYRLVRHR